uniref:NgORF13 protein n=1 Tax=Nicotiana glauca TaxID=4090 RepID=Q40393_NICGL|nr:NgORF13 protein [Nicotiana glauca]
MARLGSSPRLHVDNLCWIKEPTRLKAQLMNVVEAYKPAQPETLKYYIPSAAEHGTHVEAAYVNDAEMELHPAGLKYPLSFVFTSLAVAKAYKETKHLLCEEHWDGDLLACVVPPYQTNVSLAALRERHNSFSGGGYQEQTDMDYFVAILPDEKFGYQSLEIETRSRKGLCKIYSRELGGPLAYDAILAIGKVLLE